MIKSEQILEWLVKSKQPKDSMIQIFMNQKENANILLAMEEIAKQAFEAGRKQGIEAALYDNNIIDRNECTAPDFEEWYNEH